MAEGRNAPPRRERGARSFEMMGIAVLPVRKESYKRTE